MRAKGSSTIYHETNIFLFIDSYKKLYYSNKNIFASVLYEYITTHICELQRKSCTSCNTCLHVSLFETCREGSNRVLAIIIAIIYCTFITRHLKKYSNRKDGRYLIKKRKKKQNTVVHSITQHTRRVEIRDGQKLKINNDHLRLNISRKIFFYTSRTKTLH